MARVTIVAAMSENGVIGRDNRLPWHLPRDLKHFKALTSGHAVLMGRRTWESMSGPLPGRRNIVITRDRAYVATGGEIAHSLAQALHLAQDDEEIFIIGGSEIFREALETADVMHLTLVHAHVEGDTYFPAVKWDRWNLVRAQRFDADRSNAHAMTFQEYHRKQAT